MTVVRSFCDAKMTQVKTPKGLLFQNNVGSLRYAANIAFLCLQVGYHFKNNIKATNKVFKYLSSKGCRYESSQFVGISSICSTTNSLRSWRHREKLCSRFWSQFPYQAVSSFKVTRDCCKSCFDSSSKIKHYNSSCPNMPSTCDWSTYSSSVPNYQTLYGGNVIIQNV